MTTRTSRAEWRGDLKSGDGDLTLASGAFSGSYTFASRFESGEGTNPEELIGAAHAACFSMSLSNMLAKDGNTPEFVRTSATVHLEVVDGAQTITRIELDTVGKVPGMEPEAFELKAEAAKDACPVSRLLTGAEIVVEATLED